jgi:hypothetical protein
MMGVMRARPITLKTELLLIGTLIAASLILARMLEGAGLATLAP